MDMKPDMLIYIFQLFGFI